MAEIIDDFAEKKFKTLRVDCGLPHKSMRVNRCIRWKLLAIPVVNMNRDSWTSVFSLWADNRFKFWDLIMYEDGESQPKLPSGFAFKGSRIIPIPPLFQGIVHAEEMPERPNLNKIEEEKETKIKTWDLLKREKPTYVTDTLLDAFPYTSTSSYGTYETDETLSSESESLDSGYEEQDNVEGDNSPNTNETSQLPAKQVENDEPFSLGHRSDLLKKFVSHITDANDMK